LTLLGKGVAGRQRPTQSSFAPSATSGGRPRNARLPGHRRGPTGASSSTPWWWIVSSYDWSQEGAGGSAQPPVPVDAPAATAGCGLPAVEQLVATVVARSWRRAARASSVVAVLGIGVSALEQPPHRPGTGLVYPQPPRPRRRLPRQVGRRRDQRGVHRPPRHPALAGHLAGRARRDRHAPQQLLAQPQRQPAPRPDLLARLSRTSYAGTAPPCTPTGAAATAAAAPAPHGAGGP
jgi:hypothetical protein